MAETQKTYVSDGTTTIYTFDFDYINKTFVKVLVNGVEVGRTLSGTYQVTLDTAPEVGDVIIISRQTDNDRLVDFVDGSVLVAKDLNLSALQAIHIADEARDKASGSLLIDDDGAYTAGFRKISNLGPPTNAYDAVTKEWAETSVTSSVGAAASSASAASGSATSAAASATSAAGSSSAAYTSASAAASSSSAASTSEAGALVSAAEALISENAAATSATEAQTAQTTVQTLRDEVINAGPVPSSRNVVAGDGLSGGGDLTADRTLAVDSSVLRDTGAKQIAGATSFSDEVTFSAEATFSDDLNLAPRTGANEQSTSLFFLNDNAGGYIQSVHLSDVFNDMRIINSNGSHSWIFRNNGVAYGSGWVTTSDQKLKSDLEVIPSALAKVHKLTGYTFLKDGDAGRQGGVIAQHVLAVYPEAVREMREDADEVTLTVDPLALVGLLINAVNELSDRIGDLEDHVVGL